MTRYITKVNSKQTKTPTNELNKEFTTSRQVLAIHYLFEELKVYAVTDKTEVAKFIQFLTGKETGVAKIGDTTIYKKLKSPLPETDKGILKDLQFIRMYFEKLGFQNIVNQINKEINSRELKSGVSPQTHPKP